MRWCLLTANRVTTAAHCVEKMATAQPTVQHRDFTPDQMVIHPDFHPVYLHNDVAVIQLSKNFDWTDAVQPALLVSDDLKIPRKTRMATAVYGDYDIKRYSYFLWYAFIKLFKLQVKIKYFVFFSSFTIVSLTRCRS
ncbi:hypothetical protein L596_030095 [Steinernema carpocapsae]|uniref:Peptidase S1 domain-containing protein n=1 Tax=Steinernema carpocapsae TaxID=34508 RepID=A0A4U5LRQ0_STECR|nr:hypothetical protein L596_030095 [Steinernema carpocapsae]